MHILSIIHSFTVTVICKCVCVHVRTVCLCVAVYLKIFVDFELRVGGPHFVKLELIPICTQLAVVPIKGVSMQKN